jgi:adenosylmethionine-8-amino-7-oxononanoate aminotransferase
MLETVILNEGEESVAGFILEPIGNTGGIVVPPAEYLPRIREICDRYNVLLIFDEIITGMGRTGNWFAAHTFETTPDILCAGKGLSSGYAPLAAAAIKEEIYFSTFWGEESANVHFASGHTYGNNPISAATGLAVIEVMEQDNLMENGRRVGEHLRKRLSDEVARLGVLGEVRGKGCLACVEFVEDMETRRTFPRARMFGKRVEKRLVEAGLILRCDPDWISFAPPLITTIEQADEMVDIFVRCVAEEIKSG